MKKLKQYLTINAGFSALSGLSLILFSKFFQQFMGIDNDLVLPVIGVNLILFGGIVFYIAQKQLHKKTLVNMVSLMDGLWVLGSVLLTAFKPFDLTSKGYILIGLVAIWIAFLGYNQYRYNR